MHLHTDPLNLCEFSLITKTYSSIYVSYLWFGFAFFTPQTYQSRCTMRLTKDMHSDTFCADRHTTWLDPIMSLRIASNLQIIILMYRSMRTQMMKREFSLSYICWFVFYLYFPRYLVLLIGRIGHVFIKP